ncbi:MAG: formate-dependent phosphoribosylglycinamide formyltransferase [Neisseriaceae bacterium]|nr:formate-dependent phosphoribosylglycinamide formyltransferase [Neisseriaceae bacterium]
MLVDIGTVYIPSSTKIVLLGSGELGREIAIECIRLGLEVFALDKYPNAPAMQVAQHSLIIDMTDEVELLDVIHKIQPHYIVPEIEAIATKALVELEQEGYCVVSNASAIQLTMNREGIRSLANRLDLPTSKFEFADSLNSLKEAVQKVGVPCVIKPMMSSSGKGQSVLHDLQNIEECWEIAIQEGRIKSNKVIVEEWIDFDYEITLLTVRHGQSTSFCELIGHIQKDGDYQISWQPQKMSDSAKQKAIQIAQLMTDALGGNGVFGVELFVKGDNVWFNEVSPRPHDTGLVTLISQNLSQFALHVRAILGLPIPNIEQLGPSASHAVLVSGVRTILFIKTLIKY